MAEILGYERRTSICSLGKVDVNKNEVSDGKEKNSGLKGDYGNICLLLLLYTLQGVPTGLMYAIPMILSSNGVHYDKQAILSIANFPQAAKLLWAPIVDSVYSARFGRRKSWLIPIQYCIAISLVVISKFADDLIGSKTQAPMIIPLTSAMFVVVLLTSIQDTAVDSWGLTLLQRHNVHYVASANAVGVALGTFVSTVVFLSLESADFCNKWLRKVPQPDGMLNVQSFFFGVGILFAVSTTIIWIFKTEGSSLDAEEETKGPLHTYKLLIRLLRLKSILWFTAIQFTQFIGISVFFAAAELKAIQFGVKREVSSMLKTPVMMLNIFLPFIVVHLTKKEPLIYFWKFGIVRQMVAAFLILTVYWTQSFNNPPEFPIHFYVVILGLNILFDVILYTNIMAMFAYMTTIADPYIGATYMTLFSTLSHIGIRFATTASLALIDPLTFTRTIYVPRNETSGHSLNTTEPTFMNETLNDSMSVLVPKKEVIIDGFYVEGVFCTIFGLLWFVAFKKVIWNMQNWPLDKWRLAEFRTKSVETKNNVTDVYVVEQNKVK